MAGMTLEDIHAVELIGGGIRMPKVISTQIDGIIIITNTMSIRM
jgi:molecular chaperone DnaK (HSP70)